MIEIAIEGIDGSGKGTFMKRAKEDLEHRGFKVGCVDIPYFSLVPKFERTSNFFNTLLAKAEKYQNTFLFVVLAALAAIVYLVVRKGLQKHCDIVLTERHPAIDMVSYARLYCGAFGAWVTKFFLALWPKPNAIFFLTIPPVEAYKRLVKRGKILQPHETVSRLGVLTLLLTEQAKQSNKYYFAKDNTLENFREFLYERRISTLF